MGGNNGLVCLGTLLEFSRLGLPLENAIDTALSLERNRSIQKALVVLKRQCHDGQPLVFALEKSRLLGQRLPFTRLDLPITAQLELIHHYLHMRQTAIQDTWRTLRYPLLLAVCLGCSLAICWVWVIPSTISLFTQTGHPLPPVLHALRQYESAIQAVAFFALVLIGIAAGRRFRLWLSISHRELLWAISCALSKGASLKQAITSISISSPQFLKRQWVGFIDHMSHSPNFIRNWCHCFNLPAGESARCTIYTHHCADAARLDQLANSLIREHQQCLQGVMRVLQPIMMAIIGIVILIIIGMNYLPILYLSKIV